MIRHVTFGYLISWWALVFQATRPTVAYYCKQRILTSPWKSLNVLDFSVKFQGPEKSWQITLVLEILGITLAGPGKCWNIDVFICICSKFSMMILMNHKRFSRKSRSIFAAIGSRAENGSHFVTRDPRDASVSWPLTRMTLDPLPSPRPWHESITTTHESWWVHDYCLLFVAIWNSGYGLCSIYSMGDWVLLSK